MGTCEVEHFLRVFYLIKIAFRKRVNRVGWGKLFVGVQRVGGGFRAKEITFKEAHITVGKAITPRGAFRH